MASVISLITLDPTMKLVDSTQGATMTSRKCSAYSRLPITQKH